MWIADRNTTTRPGNVQQIGRDIYTLQTVRTDTETRRDCAAYFGEC